MKADLGFWKSMTDGHIYFLTVDFPLWGKPGPLPAGFVSHLALPVYLSIVLMNVDHDEEL